MRDARNQLKMDISDEAIESIINAEKKSNDGITRLYAEIRELAPPSSDIRQRVDSCEAVTKEIVKIERKNEWR